MASSGLLLPLACLCHDCAGAVLRTGLADTSSACATHAKCCLCRCLQRLPVRGQNTKNNARTRKGKAIAIAGKKK